MKKYLALFIVIIIVAPTIARAGAKMKIGDEVEIDLGFRLQTQFIATDNMFARTGESEERFNVRRARLRLGGHITKWMAFFIQTEKGAGVGDSGLDMRVIDSFVRLNLHPLAKIYMGQNMAPAGRQHTTTSGALMAIDRPGITNYNLTWGLNGRYGFNNANLPDGNLTLSSPASVRDLGATLFGSWSLTDTFSFKYYLGVYDGIQRAEEDKERYTGRLQMNLFDPEPGYYNSSTYLGEKRTIGVGVSYDIQNDFADDIDKGPVDYNWYSVDGFADLSLGPGAATFEVGYNNLDLDDAQQLEDTVGSQNALETQGSGWYGQAGYIYNPWKLQPWIGYEKWESDAVGGLGGFDAWRVGITYFVKGHNANIKAGYESVKTKQPIAGSNEDTVNSLIVGFYVTY